MTQIKDILTNKKDKIAFIVLGNILLKEDNLALILANKLKNIYKNKNHHYFFAQNAIENIMGNIIKFNPDIIVIIDTIKNLKFKEHTILFFEELDNITNNIFPSTHNIDIKLILNFIKSSLKKEIKEYLIAITINQDKIDIFNNTKGNKIIIKTLLQQIKN